MGIMAARAAHGEGGMNILFAEHRLVVAGVADLWLRRDKELCGVRRMGIVAARAAHGEGGMYGLFAEHRLVMAGVTKVRLRRHEPVLYSVGFFMRNVSSDDPRMARSAANA